MLPAYGARVSRDRAPRGRERERQRERDIERERERERDRERARQRERETGFTESQASPCLSHRLYSI